MLTGFEVPDAAVVAAARAGAAAGWVVLLVPAPARPLPDGLPPGTLLCPNAGEAAVLSGVADDPEGAARALRERTGGAVVVTLGAEGALVVDADGAAHRVPAPTGLRIVDATGAGDTLVGVLAAGLAAGEELLPAVGAAVAAASRSTTVAGARGGMPSRDA